jgi:hypothetical protein
VSAIIVLQVVRIVQSAYPLLTNKVWVDRHMDAIDRSADAAYGQRYLTAVQAMRRRIPLTGTVVLTGTTDLPQYEARDFMQYFLFPRKVVLLDCPSDTSLEVCVSTLAGDEVYFVVDDSLQDAPWPQGQLKIVPIGGGVLLLEPLRAGG